MRLHWDGGRATRRRQRCDSAGGILKIDPGCGGRREGGQHQSSHLRCNTKPSSHQGHPLRRRPRDGRGRGRQDVTTSAENWAKVPVSYRGPGHLGDRLPFDLSDHIDTWCRHRGPMSSDAHKHTRSWAPVSSHFSSEFCVTLIHGGARRRYDKNVFRFTKMADSVRSSNINTVMH